MGLDVATDILHQLFAQPPSDPLHPHDLTSQHGSTGHVRDTPSTSRSESVAFQSDTSPEEDQAAAWQSVSRQSSRGTQRFLRFDKMWMVDPVRMCTSFYPCVLGLTHPALT